MRISLLQILCLVGLSLTFAVGQILFKFSANRLVVDKGVWPLAQSMLSPTLISALALYATATVLWIVLITNLSLSQAYPFVMLSFLFVPILSYFFFGDTLSVGYFAGLFLMIAGAAMIVLL